jgi:hypothetical protein
MIHLFIECLRKMRRKDSDLAPLEEAEKIFDFQLLDKAGNY